MVVNRRPGLLAGLFHAVVVFVAVMCGSGCGRQDADDGSDPAVLVGGDSATVATQPRVITVTLPGEAAKMYRTGGERAVSGTLARRLETRFPHLEVVPCLERAAGIYGRTAGADGFPLAFSEFVLHWSGCPDPFATVIDVLTGDDGEEHTFNKLVVFDEAHKYIESPDLVAGLVEVVREMRHKGTSIMVASQDPPSVPTLALK